MKAETVDRELAVLFTLKQVVMDQGAAFMSETLKAMRCLTGVQPLCTSVYHPQTNCLVDMSNGTLKWMLQKFVHEIGTYWHVWLPFLLFAIRELP